MAKINWHIHSTQTKPGRRIAPVLHLQEEFDSVHVEMPCCSGLVDRAKICMLNDTSEDVPCPSLHMEVAFWPMAQNWTCEAATDAPDGSGFAQACKSRSFFEDAGS